MAKKWTAATTAKQIDTWTKAMYGESVIVTGSVAADITLGEFIEAMKTHEFEQQMFPTVQIPGQQQARADEQGNVVVTDYDAPESTPETDDGPNYQADEPRA